MAGFYHAIHGAGRGREDHTHLARCVLDREERIGLGVPVNEERGSRTATEALDFLLVRVEESVNGASRPRCLICGVPLNVSEMKLARICTMADVLH
jgi:hypothetical protein